MLHVMYSFAGAVSKLELILTTEDLAEALVLRCKTDLCHCHSKVHEMYIR